MGGEGRGEGSIGGPFVETFLLLMMIMNVKQAGIFLQITKYCFGTSHTQGFGA